MLEDREGKWTIDEVSHSPIADKFHLNTTQSKGIDYSINTYWFRYHFKNDMNHEARIAIPKSDFIHTDFYSWTSNGTPGYKMTGAGVPWSKRADLKRIMTVTYVVPPGEELLIYERNSFDYLVDRPDFLEVRFGFTEKAVQHYYDDTDPSLSSFLFGLFLLAAIFNLYFCNIQEKVQAKKN